MTTRENTKYGDRLADHDWTEPEEIEPQPRTRVRDHDITIYHDTEPEPADNYERERYDLTIRYDSDSGEPYVLLAVGHRWKGNYWRDVTDWDWRDLPTPVREAAAAALPVDGPDDLDPGTRLIPEGGESRFQKHHKPQMEQMSGDEMWGTSFLRDAVGRLESAAEAFDDGSRAEELTEQLITTTQKLVQSVEGGEQRDG